MGKRSSFPKIPKDQYQTIDKRAVEALLPFLPERVKFAEPCCGEGKLLIDLEYYYHQCVWWSDIDAPEKPDDGIIRIGNDRRDALSLTSQDLKDADMIITNPPWSRPVLHPMIDYLSALKPTWLLFDSDWAYTKQASRFLDELCTDIVAVGRLIWIPGTKVSGKDNCSWYRFDKNKQGNINFYGRKLSR